MEAAEEHTVLNTENDIVKGNLVEAASADESNVCHKPNGVDCDAKAEDDHSDMDKISQESVSADHDVELENVNIEIESKCSEGIALPESISTEDDSTTTVEPQEAVNSVTEEKAVNENDVSHVDNVPQQIDTETIIDSTEKETCIEEGIVTDTVVEMESTVSTVQFETEILVEENDNDIGDKLVIDNQNSNQSNNILNELGPNIELSEVLRSSDISEHVENNNSTKQEIFNKEELLDILEGNDMQPSDNQVVENLPITKNIITPAEIALQQLSRLKSRGGKKRRVEIKMPRSKKRDKTKSPVKDCPDAVSDNNIDEDTQQQTHLKEKLQEVQLDNKLESQVVKKQEIQLDKEKATKLDDKHEHNLGTEKPEVGLDNIVSSLVMDWEEEPIENEDSEIVKESENLIKDSEELNIKQECIISQADSVNSSVTTSPSYEPQPKLPKIEEEGPTRRLSRVIKKKVIFDPDNPDTFTKGKAKEKPKETVATKEQIPLKKPKTDQLIQISKSKSPLSKLQWKKPSSKNSKQCKRLTEVDKLLMDEGAVNMIYQLTPEAPKGKKNVKTKAEFIKKIQSSTPDGKEMKFRERKKELIRYEDGEAKKILGGKHRTSLSSSVKSPSVSEDFETHSADDSIIYRRHSSSSYSSSCMSPRHLSDVEVTSAVNVGRISQETLSDTQSEPKYNIKQENVFKSEISKTLSSELINKNDCLSIKEKLNSKLSLALNKRKRETSKSDKPAKVKKPLKVDDSKSVEHEDSLNEFNFISVTFIERLALICIKKTGLKICVEILKELEEALNYIDNRKDISITLLESQCGTLCSSLDLSLLLDENKEIRANHAYELAESVRSLLSSVARHSKLVCCGVWGACAGVALALVALSDVALASEGASFWLSAAAAPVLPGAAALTARCRALPQALVNDLVIFGRRLSSSEALQGGLISRVLWPDRFDEQVLNIAKDIAAQPMQTILLKKRLLSLRNNNEAELTFLSCLETERDLLVEYWTSVEGQELLRATLDTA